MIAKITTGTGLRGALAYDFEPKKGEPTRATWIAGTLQGTPRQMSRQAAPLRCLRPEIKAPIWRCSLSLPPSDGPRTPEFLAQIAKEFLTEMSVPHDAAWCAVHHDREHQHIHISVVRCVSPDGKLWDRANDVKRAIRATELLEQRYKLAQHSRDPPARAAPNLQDQEISKRTGKPMSKQYIQTAVDQFFKDHESDLDCKKIEEFLLKKEIDFLQTWTKKGKLQGFSFKYNGIACPASELGTMYSTKGLRARGLKFVDQREHSSESEKEFPASPALLKAVPLVAAPAVRKQDRAPQMLRLILQQQHSANQLRPLSARLDDDEPQLFKSIRAAQPLTNYAALLKTLALLGIETIKLASKVAAAVWSFVKALLALFGLGLREPTLQNYEQTQSEQITYEPYRLENAAFPKLEHDNDDQAALAVLDVVDALKNGTPEALPVAPGRDELISMLKEEASKAEGGAAEADPLAQIFDGTETEFVAPAEPLPDPIISLKQSGAEYLAAVQAVVAARQKPNCGVADSRKKLVLAEQEFAYAKGAYEQYGAINKKKFRIFSPVEKTRLLEARDMVAQAQKNLDAALARQDSAPAPAVPADTSARFQAARAALQKDGLAQVAQLQQEAAQIDDVAVKKFALARAADVKAALTLVLQMASPSELQRAIQVVNSTRAGVTAQLKEIARLKWVQAQHENFHAAADSSDEIDGIERQK